MEVDSGEAPWEVIRDMEDERRKLEERRFSLEERKFEKESEEREKDRDERDQRMKLESQERVALINLLNAMTNKLGNNSTSTDK